MKHTDWDLRELRYVLRETFRKSRKPKSSSKYPMLTVNKTPGFCVQCGYLIKPGELIVVYWGLHPVAGGWAKLRKIHALHFTKEQLLKMNKSKALQTKGI